MMLMLHIMGWQSEKSVRMLIIGEILMCAWGVG